MCSAADLLNVRLNSELLVLSGCETALGKNVAGEGLIGLQYMMLARGARSVRVLTVGSSRSGNRAS